MSYHYFCNIENCNNLRVKNGVCIKHGAKRIRKRCEIDMCQKFAIKNGLCTRHGGKQVRSLCKVENCNKSVQKGKNGLCCSHFNQESECMLCDIPIYKFGLCIDHVDRCVICNTILKDKSVCNKHIQKLKKCKITNCDRFVFYYNLCDHHVKRCDICNEPIGKSTKRCKKHNQTMNWDEIIEILIQQ
jgi:hypothetical protein